MAVIITPADIYASRFCFWRDPYCTNIVAIFYISQKRMTVTEENIPNRTYVDCPVKITGTILDKCRGILKIGLKCLELNN
jgi:hypothetical protein